MSASFFISFKVTEGKKKDTLGPNQVLYRCPQWWKKPSDYFGGFVSSIVSIVKWLETGELRENSRILICFLKALGQKYSNSDTPVWKQQDRFVRRQKPQLVFSTPFHNFLYRFWLWNPLCQGLCAGRRRVEGHLRGRGRGEPAACRARPPGARRSQGAPEGRRAPAGRPRGAGLGVGRGRGAYLSWPRVGPGGWPPAGQLALRAAACGAPWRPAGVRPRRRARTGSGRLRTRWQRRWHSRGRRWRLSGTPAGTSRDVTNRTEAAPRTRRPPGDQA